MLLKILYLLEKVSVIQLKCIGTVAANISVFFFFFFVFVFFFSLFFKSSFIQEKTT